MAVGAIREPVDGQAQVREDLVVDDVVEEYGIRVEGVLRQDDTIVKCAVLADLYVPVVQESSVYYCRAKLAVRTLTGAEINAFPREISDFLW